MDNKDILKTLELIRKNSPKRNFNQTFDLIINLKQLNLKKPEENINSFVTLHYGKGKKIKVCALVDNVLAKQAKEICDAVILKDEFAKWGGDKRGLKRLAKGIDFFIAQANLMPQIAGSFGKVLGPMGKMPSPKAGCIVPPGADLKPLCEKLQKTVRIQTKNELIVKVPVGMENMKDEEIADNISVIYNSLLSTLPQDKDNIKNVLIKLTMSPAVKIGISEAEIKEKFEKKTMPIEDKKKAEKKVSEKKNKAEEKVSETKKVKESKKDE